MGITKKITFALAEVMKSLIIWSKRVMILNFFPYPYLWIPDQLQDPERLKRQYQK
jgi:hypothetical protein